MKHATLRFVLAVGTIMMGPLWLLTLTSSVMAKGEVSRPTTFVLLICALLATGCMIKALYHGLREQSYSKKHTELR